jgi:hypothetical protein
VQKITSLILGLAIGLTVSTPVLACDFITRYPTAAEREAEADALVKRASAIIDAKVIRTEIVGQTTMSVLIPLKTYKGRKGVKQYLVTTNGDCEHNFSIGYPGRIVLFGGPEKYQADMYDIAEDDITAALKRMKKR